MKYHFIIEEVKTMVFLSYLDWEGEKQLPF